MNIRKSIVIVDSNPIYRMGVRYLLKRVGGADVIGEASGPAELKELLRSVDCDLLITDIYFPLSDSEGESGLRYIEALRKKYPKMRIVVVVATKSTVILRSILITGVSWIVSKTSFEALPHAVDRAFLNKKFIDGALGEDITKSKEDENFVFSKLSPREVEVLRLLGCGLSVNAVAGKLNRSNKTISGQKITAMKKLKVSSEVELFNIIRQNGLV